MRILMLLVLLSLVPSIGFGDTRLKGMVTDSSDAPMSNAMVFIHWDSAGSTVGLTSNVGIKEDFLVRTKADGTFNVDLPSGFYDALWSGPHF